MVQMQIYRDMAIDLNKQLGQKEKQLKKVTIKEFQRSTAHVGVSVDRATICRVFHKSDDEQQNQAK